MSSSTPRLFRGWLQLRRAQRAPGLSRLLFRRSRRGSGRTNARLPKNDGAGRSPKEPTDGRFRGGGTCWPSSPSSALSAFFSGRGSAFTRSALAVSPSLVNGLRAVRLATRLESSAAFFGSPIASNTKPALSLAIVGPVGSAAAWHLPVISSQRARWSALLAASALPTRPSRRLGLGDDLSFTHEVVRALGAGQLQGLHRLGALAGADLQRAAPNRSPRSMSFCTSGRARGAGRRQVQTLARRTPCR